MILARDECSLLIPNNASNASARRNSGPKDAYFYAGLIRRSGSSRDLEAGRRVHKQLLETGHSRNTFLINLLVQMYGRCERLDLARELFESLTRKNNFSWTIMLLAYTQNGRMREAVDFYRRRMENAGHDREQPTPFFFSAVLSACQNPEDLEIGLEVHDLIEKSGCIGDVVVATGLIGMYSRCKRVDLARKIFDKMQKKDTVSWTTMIAAYAHNWLPLQALQLFEQMSVSPNMFTISIVLNACSELGDLEKGEKIYYSATRSGLEPTTAVENSLLKLYAKNGDLQRARELFKLMRMKDEISWSTIISSEMQHGNPREAIQLFRRMDLEGVKLDDFVFASVLQACSSVQDLNTGRMIHQRIECLHQVMGLVLQSALVNMYAKCNELQNAKLVFDQIQNRDAISWTTMIVAYSQTSDPQCCSAAVDLYKQMITQGCKPDAFVYSSVLRACSELRLLSLGREIHSRVSAEKLEEEFVVKNALLNMYLRCADLREVREIFDRSLKKDAIVLNMMLAAYVQAGFPADALALFYQHQDSDAEDCIRADEFSFASAAAACAAAGTIGDAKRLHWRISHEGFDDDPVVKNALLDMYSKCGDLVEARNTFEEITSKDLVTWTSLLSGLAKHGFSREALWIFHRMVQESVPVDEICFTTVFQACSHLGLVDQGRDLFVSMKNDFGLLASVEHFVGFADLLGRSGRLADAEELLQQMPFEPTPVAWTTLLGACLLHSDTERAKQIPHCGDEIACLLMRNICATSASR